MSKIPKRRWIILNMPLRYSINDWHKLSECKSNNSRLLSISVSDFINDRRLSGIRISVKHEYLGTLFTYVIDAIGDLVDDVDGDYRSDLNTKQILEELAKYGFYIVYDQKNHLPQAQLDYLAVLSKLGYDKLRVLSTYKYVNQVKEFNQKVIVFNVDKNPSWIDAAYLASEDELNKALNSGSAINISSISKSKQFTWSWLDYVANISDILKDNGHRELFEE